MVLLIIQALYYFLPAYFSNMAPVIFRRINILPQPINKSLFGTNKTWGGLLYAIILGTAIFSIQKLIHPFLPSLSILNYTQESLLLGFLLATGAILGDLIKSFFKRRLKKKPGTPWFPFDQLDLVVGALVLSAFVYMPDIKITITLFFITPILHFAANYIGFVLKLKSVKW
jgi:CDP-2,3-bis-(O-geranylgeranyl)-sn-glycerol synthase